MSADPHALDRVRAALAGRLGVVERRMMGAVCFMVDGAMCCGVAGVTLMVRVGHEGYQQALTEPHVRPMEVGGRRPTGFVWVDLAGFATEAALATWIARGLATVDALNADGGEARRGGKASRKRRSDVLTGLALLAVLLLPGAAVAQEQAPVPATVSTCSSPGPRSCADEIASAIDASRTSIRL